MLTLNTLFTLWASIALFALRALRAGFALGALWAYLALDSLRALRADLALLALGALWAYLALDSLRALRADLALLALGALFAVLAPAGQPRIHIGRCLSVPHVPVAVIPNGGHLFHSGLGLGGGVDDLRHKCQARIRRLHLRAAHALANPRRHHTAAQFHIVLVRQDDLRLTLSGDGHVRAQHLIFEDPVLHFQIRRIECAFPRALEHHPDVRPRKLLQPGIHINRDHPGLVLALPSQVQPRQLADLKHVHLLPSHSAYQTAFAKKR